jgi:integrase
MPRLTHRTPKYAFHRPTGQARVRLDGRDHYLGRYGTPESKAEYDRVISEWLASGRRIPVSATGLPGDLSIAELIADYWKHCEGYYVKDGRPTSEADNIRRALRPLLSRYGHTRAAEFGPLALKTVRQEWVEAGLVRGAINKQVGRVLRAFKWAVENELIPPAVYQALRAVEGLKKGRTGAKEGSPVRPVADDQVEAVRPFVSRQVWAMIELQRLTGARPGEVCMMRTCDLDTSGKVWTYRPESHKTEHHGKDRVIYLGPRAQAVLRPWLRANLSQYLFSPAEAMAEKAVERRAARRTPLTPSQRARQRKARPRKAPGVRYATDSYGHAIAAACARAGIPVWRPHRLRHLVATEIRHQYGVEAAQAVCGHARLETTQVYAEASRERAARVMLEVG